MGEGVRFKGNIFSRRHTHTNIELDQSIESADQQSVLITFISLHTLILSAHFRRGKFTTATTLAGENISNQRLNNIPLPFLSMHVSNRNCYHDLLLPDKFVTTSSVSCVCPACYMCFPLCSRPGTESVIAPVSSPRNVILMPACVCVFVT